MDFRVLTKEYGRRIYWHIRRIVVSHDDAEDALQETFVKIYTKLDTFRGENDILAWIYRIATNEALQVLRRRIILLAAASVLLFVSLFWFYNDNQHAEPQDFAGNKETQVEDFLNSLSNDEVFTIGYYEVEEIDEY